MGISLVINRYQTIISLESILQLQIITVFEKAALEIVMSKKTVIQLQSRNPAASETLSAVQSCDRIFCMNHGTIVEQGTYDELIELDGYFAQLVKKQMI